MPASIYFDVLKCKYVEIEKKRKFLIMIRYGFLDVPDKFVNVSFVSELNFY